MSYHANAFSTSAESSPDSILAKLRNGAGRCSSAQKEMGVSRVRVYGMVGLNCWVKPTE